MIFDKAMNQIIARHEAKTAIQNHEPGLGLNVQQHESDP
jgi:hypothetical protein